MRRAAAIVALIAVAALVSCSHAPILHILNNTGQPIEIVRASMPGEPDAKLEGRTWTWPWRWRFMIEQGLGRDVAWSSTDKWIVEVEALNCRVVYKIPSSLEHYRDDAWREFPESANRPILKVQIERDFMLYIVHESADRTYDVQHFADIQPEGFPLQPLTSACEPA